MATDENQWVELSRQSQDTLTNAVRAWADAMQGFASGLAGPQSRPPDAWAVVEPVFVLAEQLLATQREFVKALLAPGTQATKALSDQTAEATQSATAGATNAARATAESAGQVGQFVAEQSTGNARVTTR